MQLPRAIRPLLRVLLTKSDEIAKTVSNTESRWGKIDVLFSNAGSFGVFAPVADNPEVVFDSMLAVHVKGAFLAEAR
jgi:NAD(P)-dependent dehydrogenase (short-subunit alcohol dehydrogenase family)